MDRLRTCFETMGFSNVKTFIASGNVLFDSAARNSPALESKIAGHLEQELGYEVATFIRTAAEVKRIAAAAPFPASETGAPGVSVYIGLLQEPPTPAARKGLASLRSDVDEFHTDQRELYWLCRGPMLDSKVSPAKLEKHFGRATFRNSNTLRRIAATLP